MQKQVEEMFLVERVEGPEQQNIILKSMMEETHQLHRQRTNNTTWTQSWGSAGRRMLTNLTHHTQTARGRLASRVQTGPDPMSLQTDSQGSSWGISRAVFRQNQHITLYLAFTPRLSKMQYTSSVECEIMERDSLVDSLITKMTKLSARVEFLETSG